MQSYATVVQNSRSSRPLCIVSVNYVLRYAPFAHSSLSKFSQIQNRFSSLSMRSNKEVRDLLLSEVQLGTKTSCSDSLTATAASNQTAIPSPQAAITPLSHDSIVNHHHHSARSASVPTVRMHPTHFQHVDLPAQPAVAAKIHVNHSSHSSKIPAENQSMHLPHANNYHSPMEHFEPQPQQQQQSYGNHYNSTGVIIHSTSLNGQTNAEYNDTNYYNSFYGNYDDQIMRPYSASSNSCSSSNSDADSQMAASHHHPMLPNNNQDRQSQQQQQHCHQQIGHPPNNQVLVTTNTTDLHTPNSGSHLDAANLSPEYIDCMDQRASHHQSFEVNCFGGIGNVGIHHLSSDDLQSNYMPNNHSAGVDNSNSILLNGNASSGGCVTFNGNNLSGNQSIVDGIQYPGVIVDANSYHHMSNDQYVH